MRGREDILIHKVLALQIGVSELDTSVRMKSLT